MTLQQVKTLLKKLDIFAFVDLMEAENEDLFVQAKDVLRVVKMIDVETCKEIYADTFYNFCIQIVVDCEDNMYTLEIERTKVHDCYYGEDHDPKGDFLQYQEWKGDKAFLKKIVLDNIDELEELPE